MAKFLFNRRIQHFVKKIIKCFLIVVVLIFVLVPVVIKISPNLQVKYFI